MQARGGILLLSSLFWLITACALALCCTIGLADDWVALGGGVAVSLLIYLPLVCIGDVLDPR